MRICLASQQYPPSTASGGIGTQTALKARALAARGHTVHVISSTLEGPPRIELDEAVTIFRVPYPTVDTEFCEASVLWVGHSYSVARKLMELNELDPYDLVEFPEYGAEGFVYQIEHPRPREVPVVVMLHGSLAMFAERSGWPDRNSEFYRFGTFMEEASILGADLLLSASHNIADFWQERHGEAAPPIEVVHTAVEPDLFVPSPARDSSRPVVLFVGRIDPQKGVLAVADAVIELRERYPDLLFRVVGSGSDSTLDVLRSRMSSAGADDALQLVGFLSYAALGRHYADSAVFASPAPQEHGVATVYLEAMSAALPVVACSSGGAPEAVVDGHTGILVPPGDQPALVAALDRLLGSRELRQRMGANGRERVLQRFSATRLADRVEEAYQRLLWSHRGEHAVNSVAPRAS